MKKLVVGQVLNAQPIGNYQRQAPYEVTVSKVGRKWASITRNGRDDGRIDVNTLVVDCGGYSPRAKIWLSRNEMDEHLVREAAWRKLRAFVDKSWSPPACVTTEQVEAAFLLLQDPES